jgi:hypothetical protein
MTSLLGKIFARGIEDDEEIAFRPTRNFTQADIVKLSERAASQWRDEFSNLLSCFELNGELGLWATLQTYYQSKGLSEAVSGAVEDGDEAAFIKAMFRTQCAAFVDLYEKRNALSRIQLIQDLPAAAAIEYARLRQYAGTLSAVSAAPTAVRSAAPVVTETPVEVAAREWKELSGDQFRVKYLNHQGNRKFYEQALAQGLIR